MIGLLARFFKGALSIPDMMKMKWREILFWYDNFILQSTEEEIINELRYDGKGNVKKLPKSDIIREKVLQRIAERKGEVTDELKILD